MDNSDRTHLTIAQLHGRLQALQITKERAAERYASSRRHTRDEESGYAARDALRQLLRAEEAIKEIEAELASRQQVL